MNNIAAHMRISGVTVTDSDVQSRQAAAESLAANWSKERNTTNIVSKAAEVATALGRDGVPPQTLGNEVQGMIQEEAPSFLFEERLLDVGICAGMAMVSILDTTPSQHGWTTTDVYALALWSALSYQPVLDTPRREALRLEVLNAAVDFSDLSASMARERNNVPDPSDLNVSIDEDDVVTTNYLDSISKTVEALRRNAVLDREELDFLWWVQLGRSRLLKKQLSEIAEPTRIVAAGIEGAKVLRRPPYEVHRELVLRTLDQDPKLDLTELLEVIGQDRTTLSSEIIKTHVTAHPTVFPLLHALTTGEVDHYGASIKRSVSEWGARALLENSFARLMAQGLGKI